MNIYMFSVNYQQFATLVSMPVLMTFQEEEACASTKFLIEQKRRTFKRKNVRSLTRETNCLNKPGDPQIFTIFSPPGPKTINKLELNIFKTNHQTTIIIVRFFF